MSSPAKAAPSAAVAPTERPPALAADALLGQTLDDRYRIDARIGEGGLGTVYRGQHLKLDRSVAIKVLKAELRAIPDIRHRFEREVRTLAKLSHPNIVTITDYGDAASIPYIVMELVEGDELSRFVDGSIPGGLTPTRALSVIRQILSSLAYAHSCDVVHRDLKPANVIVRSLPDGSDHATVLDFGLAKFVGDDANPAHDLTRSGLVVGTPAYLPPEQIGGGAKKSDARSDLYAVGLILFELLTGRRPFITDDAAEMLRAHLATKPPTLAEASPGSTVAPALEAIVKKALEKAPGDRFTTARAMLEAIDALGPRPMERPADPREPTGRAMSSIEIPLDSSLKVPPPRLPPWALPAGAVGLAFAFGLGLFLPRLLAPAGDGAEAPIEAPTAAVSPPRPVPPPVASGPEDEADPEEGADAAGAEDEVELTDDELALIDPALIELDVAPPVDGTAPPEGEVDLVEDPTARGGIAVSGSRPSPRNPWVGRVPRQLVRLRQSHARGGLSSGELRVLTRYRNEHSLDVRPRLLLAHAFVSRGWYTAALDQYERAFSSDLACRGEPGALAELIRIARTAGLAARASNMIVAVYGPEARDGVEHAIARERDDGARGRLEVLRARLD